MKDSDRKPPTVDTCYVHGGSFDYTSRAILLGGRYEGGTWQSSLYSCYATTRRHFEEQTPTYGLREFYTSDDGTRSTAACWDNSTPGC